jgi:hypothetical protein
MDRTPEWEPAFPQAPHHGVVVLGARGAGIHPSLHQADRPGMAPQRLTSSHPAPAQFRPPGTPDGGGVHLGEDDIDHAVEELFLVREMAIEGHRGGVQLLREAAHAEGLEAARVGKGDGDPDDPLHAQRNLLCGSRPSRHLTSLGNLPGSPI